MSILIDNLESDLIEFLRLTPLEASEMKENCRKEAKSRWMANTPATGIEANQFYLSASHCPAQYTAWVERDETIRGWPEFLARHHLAREWGKILDYGAGISTTPLVMTELGCSGIELADFLCPAFSFAQWKAWKYELDVKYRYFHPALEVQPIFKTYDCIICSHVIGHSFHPYSMLSYILSQAKFVFWCYDFRTTRDASMNLYPQHRRKPPEWDEIFSESTRRVDKWLFESKVTGIRPEELSAKWIASSGWTPEFND